MRISVFRIAGCFAPSPSNAFSSTSASTWFPVRRMICLPGNNKASSRKRLSVQHGPRMSSSRSSENPPPRVKVAADLTKWTVCAIVGAFLLTYRDALSVLYVIGAGINSATGKLLKRVIKQPRPTSAKSDHGMPSSHATSLSFLSVLSVVHVVVGRGVPWMWGAAGMFMVGAIMASGWRVKAGYHTWEQVVAGWLLGSVNAVVWGARIVPAVSGSVEGVMSNAVAGWIVVVGMGLVS